MAKAKPSAEAAAAIAEAKAAAEAAAEAAKSQTSGVEQVFNPDNDPQPEQAPPADTEGNGKPIGESDTAPVEGKHELNPSIPTDKELAAQTKAAEKAAAQAKKDEEKKAKADAAAAKKAQAEADKKAKADARAAAKAEREARLAELAKEGAYQGSMLALADKVKSGVYVKGLSGQLRSNDPIAVALDGIAPTNVIRVCLDLLKLEENPYHALNVGQQSMNLRNKLRGAIKKEVIKITDIDDYVIRNNIHRVTQADVEKEKAERAAAKAAREAEAAAKKAKARPVTDSAGNPLIDGKTQGQLDAEAENQSAAEQE